MKLYGIWNIEEEKLNCYLTRIRENKYFGTKEELQDEIGWLNCETGGEVECYFQIAELNCETGAVVLKDIE